MTPRRSVMPAFLIVAGILLVITAAAWRWLDEPTDSAVRTAEVSCTMRNVADDDCDVPAAETVGPIVMAIGGGVLALFGVILAAGGRQRIVYVERGA